MPHKIDTVIAREKLIVRRMPYWHRIRMGCYVGFRKMTAETSGSWVARRRTESGSQLHISLGPLTEFRPHERFDKAAAAACQWFAQAGMGSVSRPLTVAEACNAYVKKVSEEKGAKPAKDLADRYHRWVQTDLICNVEVAKLTREQVARFRKRLVDAPVKVNNAGVVRVRSKDSVNRDMAALRAALNYAVTEGRVVSNFAWSQPLKAFQKVSKRRGIYLDLAQRREFIKYAPKDLSLFLNGLSSLPLRPGALAALLVRDFDSRLAVLSIGKDKTGQTRKIKLPPKTAQICSDAIEGKDAMAPLFARTNGQAWNKDSWKWPIKEAAKRAGLPAQTTAYSIRHSIITDLVHGGLDLLTVAQLSGTSGHLEKLPR